MTLHHRIHLLPPDGGDERGRHGLDAVIHFFQKTDVQVTAIARHQKGKYLTRAIG